MRFVARVLLTLVIALLSLPSAARAAGDAPLNVYDRAEVLVASAACDGDAVHIALLPESCFEPAKALKPNVATWYFHPATHWYRFTLPAGGGTPTHWILSVSTFVTDGELDVVTPDGRVIQHQVYGSVIPVAARPIYAHDLDVPIVAPLPPNAVVELRMTSPFEQPNAVTLQTSEALAATNSMTMRDEALPLAFLNGFAVAMALFNLMLFGMLRRKLYALYATAMLSLVLYQVLQTGAAWTMLWPNVGLRDDWPPYAAWVLYFVLIVAFTREILELPRISIVMDRILVGVVSLLAFESAVYVLVPNVLYALGIYEFTDVLMTVLMLGTMLAAGVVAWRAEISVAPYYVLAFAGSAIGFIVSDAGTYGLYPSSVTATYIATSIGVAWESIFLALALGQHVREIESSAARYEKYAYLDPLTNIPNRRSFDESIEREWRRTQRAPGPISVIIFDIDHFKDYNDRFGHPAGDLRLVSVARVIAEAARRTGDMAARYGGEEFAMLLPGTPLEGAVAIAETVRLGVREAVDVEYRLTISAGCATAYPYSDPLDSSGPLTLLADADAALYIAKTTGRDRVCIPEPEAQLVTESEA